MKLALERLTAVLLWLVVAFLARVLLAAYVPATADIVPERAEVVAVLVLLVGTLGLVSVLALVHAAADVGPSPGVQPLQPSRTGFEVTRLPSNSRAQPFDNESGVTQG